MFLAGVVLYNPCINRLKDNINSIYNQVECIICINNNSKNYKDIEALLNEYRKVILINNDNNMGMGYALNQIVKWGIENNYKWAITLDQDSICPNNIIDEYSKYINIEKMAIITPVIEDANRNNESNYLKEFEFIENPEDVITSGSFISLDICKRIGYFNEKMFIDFIDIEYNNRIINEGYKIIRINYIKLFHEIGKIKEYRIGKWTISCSNHNAIRRYYMARNRLYYKEKYFGKISFYKEIVRLILGVLKVWILEEDKFEKTKATIKGGIDYKKMY